MKRIMMVLLALMLAISLAGCSLDSLGDYKEAAEKTDQIKKGQTAGEFSVKMDFNTEGMTEEQIKELNYFRTMKGSFNAVFDEDEGVEKGIIRNYFNFGGLGFDFDLFIDGEEAYMKLPVIGKYMRLEEMQSSMMQQPENGEIEIVSKETLDGINEKWLGMLKKEDIFQGKNIVLTTPDGEVKTTEYTIKLNDEQIKSLVVHSLDLLSKDEKLIENYEEYIKKNVEHLKDTSVEKLLSDMKESITEYTVENFSYTAYVDIDGYIVNEMIDISLKVENTKPATATRLDYKLDIKNWDINKDQKFDFPVLTEDNTLDMDKMDENMPFMMEDLFKNKD
jgi:hypothetical protein